MKYTVFPTIDLQEVPREEIDKRNLVPRKSVNESETLMKCQHYAELFPHKMIRLLLMTDRKSYLFLILSTKVMI